MRAELHAQGYRVGRWRIRRALVAADLRAQQPRSFVPSTTDSDPNVRAAPNRLLGQPVGWDVRKSMAEALVSEALRRALAVRRPCAGLIINSDQGSQYSATNFKNFGLG